MSTCNYKVIKFDDQTFIVDVGDVECVSWQVVAKFYESKLADECCSFMNSLSISTFQSNEVSKSVDDRPAGRSSWNDDKDTTLIELFHRGYRNRDIAKVIGHTEKSVKSRRSRLGLKRSAGQKALLTKQQGDALLLRSGEGADFNELAREFGITAEQAKNYRRNHRDRFNQLAKERSDMDGTEESTPPPAVAPPKKSPQNNNFVNRTASAVVNFVGSSNPRTAGAISDIVVAMQRDGDVVVPLGEGRFMVNSAVLSVSELVEKYNDRRKRSGLDVIGVSSAVMDKCRSAPRERIADELKV